MGTEARLAELGSNSPPRRSRWPTTAWRCGPEISSSLLVEVFGPDAGSHARSAVGMAELPFGLAVEIEMVVELE
jgi:hypothetical protein